MHFSIAVNLPFCDLRDIRGQYARKIAINFLPIWELSQQDQFLVNQTTSSIVHAQELDLFCILSCAFVAAIKPL